MVRYINTQKRKLNNRGFTLVELLVALAIGGIVLAALAVLVSQGVSNYRRQTLTAQLQNDANITLNQMADNIMEADMLTLVKGSSTDMNYIRVKEKVYYIYRDGIIYQSETADISKGSVLCEHVTEFRVRMLKSGIREDDAGRAAGLSKNIQVRIDIRLENMGESRQADRTTALRNRLNDITYAEADGIVSEDKLKSIMGTGMEALKDYLTDGQ